MTYGKTWHEGRAVRHHNLVAATQPPITGPIDKGKGKSNTAGKGKGGPKNPNAEPAFWMRTFRVAVNTATGSQDLTLSGLEWTPKAARVVFQEQVTLGSIAPLIGSVGCTDGTNEYYSSFQSSDNVAANSTSSANRRAGTTRLGLLMSNLGTGNIARDFETTSLIPGGVRINVLTNTGSAASSIAVTLFGGTSMTASVGSAALAAQNASTTVSPGFQTNILITDSDNSALDGTDRTPNIITSGMASFNGTTIRQACNLFRVDETNPRPTRGEVRNDGVYAALSSRYAELANITSTAFDLTSRGASLVGQSLGYLAISLGGAAEAYVGVFDSPIATGDKDFTGPTFTPQGALLIPTMLSAVNTEDSAGGGSAFGYSMTDGTRELSNHFRERDNVATTVAKNEIDNVLVNMSDHTGTAAFDATFSSFLSNGMRANFTTANGTARKWPILMVG